MPKTRITVVTPSLNQGPFIERTVASVLDQAGDFELEYLVMDGGSTDATLDILRRFQHRLTWVSEPDRGQADAVNKGLRRATGDIVGWVNSDDVLAPGALARVATVFRDRPEVQWLHGRCEIIDAQDRIIRRWITTYKDWCCRHYSYRRLLTENFISQMTVFWRRSILDRVGYLDDHLHHVFDYDMWLRLGKHWEPAYVSSRLASFRWYATSKSGASFVPQLEEACAVAARHGAAHPRLLATQRRKAAIVRAIYKGMTLLAVR